MKATVRDDGLVRKVGPWGLAASIIGIVVGAGIFTVPAALAAAVGSYAPLAFLVCGLVIGAVAICFAEGGVVFPPAAGLTDISPRLSGLSRALLPVRCSWLVMCSPVEALRPRWRTYVPPWPRRGSRQRCI